MVYYDLDCDQGDGLRRDIKSQKYCGGKTTHKVENTEFRKIQ